MSTLPDPVPARAFLIMATSDRYPAVPLIVFQDEVAAQAWQDKLIDYHLSRPAPPDNEDDWEAYDTLISAWRRGHPGGELVADHQSFPLLEIPQGDPPTLLGYVNARALGHFQDGRATSVDVVRDKATLWRSRGRDGDPVAVFVQGEDDSDLVSQAREALASGETPVPADPAALRNAVDPSV